MRIRAVTICFALLLAGPVLGRESTDVIVMKNDDRITCEVKGLSGGVPSVSPSYILGTTNASYYIETTGYSTSPDCSERSRSSRAWPRK